MDIGIDIEKIGRFKLKRDAALIKNIFTKKEIEYCYSKTKPQMHLCGVFCTKEAVKKTMQQKGISLKDIEVTHAKNGKPTVKLHGPKNSKISFLVSISHTDEYAVATAIRTP